MVGCPVSTVQARLFLKGQRHQRHLIANERATLICLQLKVGRLGAPKGMAPMMRSCPACGWCFTAKKYVTNSFEDMYALQNEFTKNGKPWVYT